MGLAEASTDRDAHRRGVPPVPRRRLPARPSVAGDSSTSAASTPTPMPSPLDQAEVVVAISAGLDARPRSGSATSTPSASGTACASGCSRSRSTCRRSKRPPRASTPTSTCSPAPSELAELAAARPLLDLRAVRRRGDAARRLRLLPRLAVAGRQRRHVAERHRTDPRRGRRRRLQGVGVDQGTRVHRPRVRGADRLGLVHGAGRHDRGRRPDAVLPGDRVGRRATAGRRRTGWRWSCCARPGRSSTTPGSRHEVPFDDPVVVDAIRTVGEMVHRPGYLDTSPERRRAARLPGRAARLHRAAGRVPDDAVPELPARHHRRPTSTCPSATSPSRRSGRLRRRRRRRRRLRRRGHRPPRGASVHGGAGLARLGHRRGAARLAGAAAGQRPLRRRRHGQPGDGRDRRGDPGRDPLRRLPVRRLRLHAARGRAGRSTTA